MLKRKYKHIYFLGIGGIGMSALARYFHSREHIVAGYDKTPSPLTLKLEEEGIAVHYVDLGENVQELVGEVDSTLVVLTPAIPDELKELNYIKAKGYTILKRAKVLGLISDDWKTLAVAGTHGKTTTSTLLAHVLNQTSEKCNAFLGGISSNFNSNVLIEPSSPWMVVEADEYDRSFLQLHPSSAIITSIEPDHLDIFKEKSKMVEAFREFAALVSKDGFLIIHASIQSEKGFERGITYGLGEESGASFKGLNLRIQDGVFTMDIQTPTDEYQAVQIGLPGIHNAENALAVVTLTETLGIPFSEIRPSLKSFKGVKRRFEVIVQNKDIVYIDDYAHHPTAIHRLLTSLRMIYGERTIHIIFQPHLYTRTRDFMDEFATSLKEADEVILMPIYPAREKPIEGITSKELAKLVGNHVKVLEPKEVIEEVKTIRDGIILTVGAGNIDRLVEPIKNALS